MRPMRWATALSSLAIAGQGVAYGLAVVLARSLDVQAFETYAVASALFILMVPLVLQGLDKYALQLLPALAERADWGGVRAYLRWGVWRTLVAALLVGGVVAAWAWWFSGLPMASRLALVVCCLSLPAGALVHLGHEALSALGRAWAATVVFRVAVPGMALGVFGLWQLGAAAPSGAMAVGSWGLAWVLALGLVVWQLRQVVPGAADTADCAAEGPVWLARARPFWTYRMAQVALAQMGILGLHVLGTSSVAVGAFAAALGTANLALVIATATHRVFARQLSVLLERRDFAAIQALRRQRLQWLVLPIGVYLAAVLVLAPEILGLFRPEFAQEGATALRLLAVSVAFMMLFALAPTYLKFRRRHGWLFQAVAVAAVVQGALLWLLVPRLGATGAALAYGVSMGGLYGGLALLAYRELRGLRSLSEPPP